MRVASTELPKGQKRVHLPPLWEKYMCPSPLPYTFKLGVPLFASLASMR